MQAHYSAAAKGIGLTGVQLEQHWARMGPAVRAVAEADLAARAGMRVPPTHGDMRLSVPHGDTRMMPSPSSFSTRL